MKDYYLGKQHFQGIKYFWLFREKHVLRTLFLKTETEMDQSNWHDR